MNFPESESPTRITETGWGARGNSLLSELIVPDPRAHLGSSAVDSYLPFQGT